MTTKPNTPHITQVRQALLDTLADLRCRTHPMDIDRAKAVATVAGVLVDSARVENDYLKLTGQDRSEFLEVGTDTGLPKIGHDGTPTAHNPFPISARHALQG